MYQGIRDLRTENPGQLRMDLQRWNQLVERAFQDVEVSAGRWSVVFASRDAQAQHRDLVLVDATENVNVGLPVSRPETRGLPTRVARRHGAQVITVYAVDGGTVNGGASIQLASAIGKMVEFVDDGEGGFWGSV
jgi:hypothetical protein